MKRVAQCCCGSLRAETTGDPTIIIACHCQECQRRTGSVFGVGAYFKKEQVRVEGVNHVYTRRGQQDRKLHFHFCPVCGTTVYWAMDMRPDHLGVAVGAFADRSFSAPARSVWEETRHPWVAFQHDIEHFSKGAAPNAR